MLGVSGEYGSEVEAEEMEKVGEHGEGGLLRDGEWIGGGSELVGTVAPIEARSKRAARGMYGVKSSFSSSSSSSQNEAEAAVRDGIAKRGTGGGTEITAGFERITRADARRFMDLKMALGLAGEQTFSAKLRSDVELFVAIGSVGCKMDRDSSSG